MVRPDNLTANKCTRQILEDLETIRENLLTLSDDVWLSIDHNDSQAFEQGTQFKRSYNEKMAAFNRLADELSALIQQYTAVSLEAEEQTGAGDREHNARIIAELNREVPHSLDEEFTYKRPHGFILEGQAATGITTWRRLYDLLCRQLLRRDPSLFHALVDHPEFVTNQGKRRFARDEAGMNSPSLIGDGVYAEVCMSANAFRDQIRRLLAVFEIPGDQLKLFLRQDRDAARDGRTS